MVEHGWVRSKCSVGVGSIIITQQQLGDNERQNLRELPYPPRQVMLEHFRTSYTGKPGPSSTSVPFGLADNNICQVGGGQRELMIPFREGCLSPEKAQNHWSR